MSSDRSLDYEQFDSEYRRVLEAAGRGAGDAELRTEIERLRGLSEELGDPADRTEAGFDIQMLEDILSAPPQEPASPAVEAANQAYVEAVREGGTPAERIERVQRGIEEISRIAVQAEPDDQPSIYGLNESLYMLVGALQADE